MIFWNSLKCKYVVIQGFLGYSAICIYSTTSTTPKKISKDINNVHKREKDINAADSIPAQIYLAANHNFLKEYLHNKFDRLANY